MAFDVDALVRQATQGQDTTAKTDVKVSSGESAQTKSKSGIAA